MSARKAAKEKARRGQRAREWLQKKNKEKAKAIREGRPDPQPKPETKPRTKPAPPARRQIIEWNAERLKCIEATIHFRVLGRDGQAPQLLEIRRAERGVLVASINGMRDNSRHVTEGLEKAEFFFRDMAMVLARTLNGRVNP